MAPNAIVDFPPAPHLGDLDLPTLAAFDFHFQSVEEFLASEPPPERKPKTAKPQPPSGEPVPIGSSITTSHVKDLHELLQSRRRRLIPAFDCVAVPNGFRCTLTLADVASGDLATTCETRDVYPSKKHAKEAAAALGLEFVRTLSPETAGRARPKGGSSEVEYEEEINDGQNWVGLLSNFCVTRSCRPEFTYFAAGTGIAQSFSCELKLPAKIALTGVENEVFGGRNKAFRTKKACKVAAARDAMLWINQLSPATVQASTAESLARSPENSTTSSQDSVIRVPKDAPAVQKLAVMCPGLSLSQPEYDLQSDKGAPGFYDGVAIVRRRHGQKDLKFGPFRNLFGKKKAKESMAGYIYKWLVKNEAPRLGVTVIDDA